MIGSTFDPIFAARILKHVEFTHELHSHSKEQEKIIRPSVRHHRGLGFPAARGEFSIVSATLLVHPPLFLLNQSQQTERKKQTRNRKSAVAVSEQRNR